MSINLYHGTQRNNYSKSWRELYCTFGRSSVVSLRITVYRGSTVSQLALSPADIKCARHLNPAPTPASGVEGNSSTRTTSSATSRPRERTTAEGSAGSAAARNARSAPATWRSAPSAPARASGASAAAAAAKYATGVGSTPRSLTACAMAAAVAQMCW